MKYKDTKRKYEDSVKITCELSDDEREFLLSNKNTEEGENIQQDIRMKTLYYISNKKGKVIHSSVYEQIMDAHSVLRNLINNESKGGPYHIDRVKIPIEEKDLYQIAIQRIHENDEGRQYLQHMRYTDIMVGRDNTNSYIESLENNKENIKILCDTKRINIIGIHKKN